MNPPIRVAVLGYGLAGRVFHCPFIAAVPGLSLDVIVQRTGHSASEDYPHARVLRSPEAAFADPNIDLIVVATPNDTHEALARAALHAGKHVVVDKPLAPSLAAIQSLIDAATRAGKLLLPFHNRRWDGDFLTVQQLLQAGKLGRVVKVISQWDRFRPLPREGTWKESAGPAYGLLQDLGPHLLDQALVLFGLPTHLTANVRKDRDHSAIEDAWDITLQYTLPTGSQLLYECHATMIAAEPSPRFCLHGTLGSFIKHGLDPQEPHLVAGGRLPPTLGSTIPWLDEEERHWGNLTLAPNPAEPTLLTRTTLPTTPGDYRLFYAGVRDAILHGTPPPVPATAALQVAQLIELARQSSQERRTLSVNRSHNETSP